MDIVLHKDVDAKGVIKALHQCGIDDAVCCQNEETFKLAKLVLVKEKLENVTIQLLDDDGYAIRQVTSRKRDKEANKDQLNDRQVAVIKALEKVFKHCQKEGIQVIGYSDELVALPAHIPAEEISAAGALDINCHNVYKGADAVLPE